MEHYDVAIVGAGPAGCRAAWRLARAGARVAIFDGSHPREKPCGGGVTGRALQLVRDAIDPGSIRAVTIEDITFEHGPRRAQVVLETAASAPYLAVTPRMAFDGALLEAALHAGVMWRPERVREVVWDHGEWQVSTRRDTTRAPWIVGADGPTSLVRRRVGHAFERADLSIAAGFYVHGVASHSVGIAFEDSPPGYLWSFPRPDHLAVGVCAQADRAQASTLFARASNWIERNVSGTFTLERYSWPIPSLRTSTLERERPSGSQWLLLGDAAGMVDPLTREGIFFALASAEAAADSLLEARNSAQVYIERVRTLVYDELIRAAGLKSRFFNPRFTSLLLRGLAESAPIRDIMADLVAGRQSYRGLRRRLLGTMQLGLLLEMLKK